MTGQDETSPGIGGEAGENGLAVAVMPVARDRHRQLLEISLLRFGLENDEPSGSWNGRPCRNRSLIRLKMAVFIPMPSARVITARRVNAGDFRSWRMSEAEIDHGNLRFDCDFRLENSFGAESDDWIDAGGAARGQPGSDRDARRKNESSAEPDQWIARGISGH